MNDAFIINGAKKDELIAADPKSAEIIRPILRGKDIKRYSYRFADQWLIATFPSRHYNIDNYPAVRDYLLTFDKRRLAQTGEKDIDGIDRNDARKKTNNQWFETQDSISYWEDFSKQKILYSEISDLPKFAFDDNAEFYITNKVFLMVGDHLKLLLAFLNSKLCQKYFSYIAPTTGEGTIQWFKYKVETIPIPKFSYTEEQEISKIVENILNKIETNSQTLEEEYILEKILYKQYNFNDDEYNVIHPT